MTNRPSSNIRSSRKRYILRLMYGSIVLSLLVFGADGGLIFGLSWYSSPAPAILSIIHHITLIALSRKENKSQSHLNPNVMPAVAKLGTVICLWLLSLLWLAIGGIVAYNLHRERYRQIGGPYTKPILGPLPESGVHIIYPLILSAIVAEFVVVVSIAILATLERSVWRKNSRVVLDA